MADAGEIKVVHGAQKGLQTVYEILGVTESIFEEFENLNFKSSLLTNAAAATGMTPAASPKVSPPTVSPATPITPGGVVAPALEGVSLALKGEEALQDSLTRLAVLRDRYVTLSSGLEGAIQTVCDHESDPPNAQEGDNNMISGLIQRRQALRNVGCVDSGHLSCPTNHGLQEVVQRNAVLKRLIDRLRDAQEAIKLTSPSTADRNSIHSSKFERFTASGTTTQSQPQDK